MNLRERFERQQQRWRSRKKRLKRILKPLPRRGNVERYPIVKWFANAARKRPYLWSFKRQNVLPAVYVGTILSLMPTYGIQLIIAFAAAWLIRANLTVMVGLQFITNPLTIAPIYWFTDWVGLQVMKYTGIGTPPPEIDSMGDLMNSVGTHFNALVIGGIVVGVIASFVVDGLWRFFAWEARHFNQQLQALREEIERFKD
jgi:uncharacterized protein